MFPIYEFQRHLGMQEIRCTNLYFAYKIPTQKCRVLGYLAVPLFQELIFKRCAIVQVFKV